MGQYKWMNQEASALTYHWLVFALRQSCQGNQASRSKGKSNVHLQEKATLKTGQWHTNPFFQPTTYSSPMSRLPRELVHTSGQSPLITTSPPLPGEPTNTGHDSTPQKLEKEVREGRGRAGSSRLSLSRIIKSSHIAPNNKRDEGRKFISPSHIHHKTALQTYLRRETANTTLSSNLR